MAGPRFDEKDDANLIEFFAHPGRLLEDRTLAFKLLGPKSEFAWSRLHKADAWKRRSTAIPDFDGRVLQVARQRQAGALETEPSSDEEEEEEEAKPTPTPPPKTRKVSIAPPKKLAKAKATQQGAALEDLLVALTNVVGSAAVLKLEMEEENSEVESDESEEEDEEELKHKPSRVPVNTRTHRAPAKPKPQATSKPMSTAKSKPKSKVAAAPPTKPTRKNSAKFIPKKRKKEDSDDEALPVKKKRTNR
ncbi:hypothetical protein B0H11DRAFT_2088477 [Mycena galericulata]|nr:hypothetical protein B0H11DRAFT_2088477 [Mycena galericulata]